MHIFVRKEKIMKKTRLMIALLLLCSVLLLPACGNDTAVKDDSSRSSSAGEVDGAGKDLADDAKDMADDAKEGAKDVADDAKDMGKDVADGMKDAADDVKDSMTSDDGADSGSGSPDRTGTSGSAAGTER